jgi:probable rRNA maturation factor
MSASITVHNRQRAMKVDIAALQNFARRALEMSLKHRSGKTRPLKLPQIDVILVSDRRMSALHRRFFQIAGPTDVITFQHGEILISVETARRQAGIYRNTLLQEIQLYLVHGLLHLRGFTDNVRSHAKAMRSLQERIAREALKI